MAGEIQGSQEAQLSNTYRSPIIPGHEIVGNVHAVGPGVKNFKIGERVGGPWHGGHDGVLKQTSHGWMDGWMDVPHPMNQKRTRNLEANVDENGFSPLGVCKECNRGDFQLCDNEEINGVTRSGGC